MCFCVVRSVQQRYFSYRRHVETYVSLDEFGADISFEGVPASRIEINTGCDLDPALLKPDTISREEVMQARTKRLFFAIPIPGTTVNDTRKSSSK